MEDTTVALTTELKSIPYVDLTLGILKDFNVRVINRGYNKFFIPPKQVYNATDYTVEGDYSSAAFIVGAAAATKSNATIRNLRGESKQADKQILDIAAELSSCRSSPVSDLVTTSPARTDDQVPPQGDSSTPRTGLPEVDSLFNGFRPSELTVLLSRPGMGRTSLALNMATNMALGSFACPVLDGAEPEDIPECCYDKDTGECPKYRRDRR